MTNRNVLFCDDGTERTLPTRWAICGACDGDGRTSRHIERACGGFTASEWAEECDGDPDFADDYFAGRYDRACDECDGSGKVREVNEEALSDEDREALREQREADRYLAAERAAERRWGA